MDLFDKVDKLRQDMDAEVKTSFKWVVLAAVFGLVVVLTFYVMVVRAHADTGDIASSSPYRSF
jgi:signal transduction histidine kinase